MTIEEGAAARFTPPTLVDQVAPAGGEEEAVAPLDDLLQHVAALEHRDDFGHRLMRSDERFVQLLERQRVILERGVDHAGGYRELAGRHHGLSRRSARRKA